MLKSGASGGCTEIIASASIFSILFESNNIIALTNKL